MKLHILGIMVFILTGCSTAMTKQIPMVIPDGTGGGNYLEPKGKVKDGMWGYPYSGLRLNLMWWDCMGNFVSSDKTESENLWLAYAFTGFVFPYVLADTILSGTLDTLLLPVDYFYTPEQDHYQTTYCFGYGDSWGAGSEQKYNRVAEGL